jgi:hypothetical protein
MAIIHTKLDALSGFYMPRRLPASTLSVSRRIFNSEIDYRNPFLDLNALLHRQRKCKATDPRDKVFSLLSVATGDAVPSIKVNYHQAVEETYTYTARNIIEAAKQLRILVCVDIPRQESTLPSWVPDWRFDTNIPNPLASNVSDKESREVQYSATGNSKATLTKQPDPFKLSLLGVHMGKICHVSPPAITDSEDPDFNLDAILKDKSAWTDIALSAAIQGGLYLPTGESFMTVFTRTRTAGKWADDEMGKASASSDPEYATATRAMASMLLCVPNRLLFTTSNGYMGLGPKMAQVGDLVYLFLGGELPYVLRRHEDTDTFQFIGECYVHGLMNGEGLVDARKKSRPTELPPEDNSWLDSLDEPEEGELPFETEVVTLV